MNGALGLLSWTWCGLSLELASGLPLLRRGLDLAGHAGSIELV